jgi:hypothetical protein
MVEYKNKSYYKLNIEETGIEENNDIVLSIDKFNNVIDYFLSLVEPEKYIQCDNCGVPISPTSNRQKFCKSCWEEKRKNDINENAKRYYHEIKKDRYK